MPLLAVKVSGQPPTAAAAGLPCSSPVAPSNVIPAGNSPETEYVIDGFPVAVTKNELFVPGAKIALFGLVNTGAPGQNTLVLARTSKAFEKLAATMRATLS